MHLSNMFADIVPFKLTDIGEGIAEVQIKQWYGSIEYAIVIAIIDRFVNVNDKIREFDRLCEVQSDKASVTVTSRYSGTIRKLHFSVDDVVPVGSTLVDIETEDSIPAHVLSINTQRPSGVMFTRNIAFVIRQLNANLFQHFRKMHLSNMFADIVPFKLTDIGEGIAEVQIKQWYGSIEYAIVIAIIDRFVNVNDKIREFDRLCEVQSDKASVTVTSRYSGTIRKLHFSVDDVVPVGSTLVDIETEDSRALPTVRMEVDGVQRNVLVDTGSSKCVAHVSCCMNWRKSCASIIAVDGNEIRCQGEGVVHLQSADGGQAKVDVIVTAKKPLGFDFILGMNAIMAFGGVSVGPRGYVRFGAKRKEVCAADVVSIKMDEKDFVLTFNPLTRCWTAAWKWSDSKGPDVLRNKIKEYAPAASASARTAYKEELQRWIENGWLVPYDKSKYGPAKGLIPLMAVVQRNKKKVRPVMDFRELNGFIETFTADADVCTQRLREWRRQGMNVSVIDLKTAYLQIHIDKSLWPFQTVMVEGRRFCLTRLGFGLNVAPLVMKTALNCVLSQDKDIKRGTSAYLDDVLVNEDVVKASRVEQHLARYGLLCKVHERVAEGARVLGLRVWGSTQLTRRSVFSYCGRLTGHFPVCGWLRVAVAFIKRTVTAATSSWDEAVEDGWLKPLLNEIAARVSREDPVRGRWDVSGNQARVWVDASALAIGAALEVDGSIVEDSAWLRPNDARHINMAELDAVIKGLNLALSWKMRSIELMTDSSMVFRWISDGLSGRARLKTKAANELLIRRRVGTVLSLVKEYGLELTVKLVKSANNRADALTRVPQRWLAIASAARKPVCAATNDVNVERLIRTLHHTAGHPGVRRTVYFARRINPTVPRRLVRQVVADCQVCRTVDPAPVRWKRGTLEVKKTWQRVAMDITHFRGRPYLSLIDCGPSRFAVWRPLRLQTSADVVEQLETIFCERGAPEELLTDNDTAFRIRTFSQLTARWNVRVRFRCAYAPSGNGIVERCHRSVKVIAMRKGCSVPEAVYLYNIMPRDNRTAQSTPANAVYRYDVRLRGIDQPLQEEEPKDSPYAVGDKVWVKPPAVRCDTRFQSGTVTGTLSRQAVIVNETPRHVRDLRRRSPSQERRDEQPRTADQDDDLVIHFPGGDRAQTDQAPEAAVEGLRRSTRILVQCIVSAIVVGDGEAETEAKEANSSAESHELGNHPKCLEQLNGTLLATPAVRNLAREKQIDLQQVIGSGPNGRVTKKDVLNHIEKLKHASMDISETFNPVAADYKVVPIRGYARTMLKNMTVASSIPHFTFSDEVNMNGLVALKESLKQVQSANGAKITYMPFFVKALSLALHKYPIMNAQFDEKRSSIVHQFVHNVCFAVDTPNGLVAPAIKSCERKSVLEIASEMFTLRKKAVEGTLSHEELTGGTITLSNIGTIGGTYASPVLLPPQVTIGAIGRIQLLPRYDEERRLQPTFILCVSWSADHRVLDGAIVAKFSNIWKEYVETPSLIDSTFH
ncbi:hypothetical protein M513_01041 [Trichuris suis]|uniref:Lipoamide acyltransferase component of branched-chain alpha-keto acid dehydrogenase complex, mitochondrial n=1 Tax=Trichuris suis TaxID=68888 RepID=A0A085MM32_9BILA|nr:hypothetical protein M513_01041 [Trichuris suis]